MYKEWVIRVLQKKQGKASHSPTLFTKTRAQKSGDFWAQEKKRSIAVKGR